MLKTIISNHRMALLSSFCKLMAKDKRLHVAINVRMAWMIGFTYSSHKTCRKQDMLSAKLN